MSAFLLWLLVQTLYIQGFLELSVQPALPLPLPPQPQDAWLPSWPVNSPGGALGSAGLCTLAALPGSTVLVLAASLAEAGASRS